MAWRGPITKPVTNRPPRDPIKYGPELSEGKKPVEEAVAGPEYKPNRAYNVRRDKDTQKNFSVELLDIDWTIMSHMDTVISPTIIDSGRQVKVPVNYASPERWKAIKKDGVMRDKNGKVQTPAIAFRRSAMQRNDNLMTLNRYLQYPVIKKFSEKNKYDKFSLLSSFNPVHEVYSVAMPDHVIVNYEFIIWTELIEQGNSIVEAINFATDDYWGDKKRFKFRTTISDYNFETSTEAGNDRIVKCTFTLMCYAYLLPDKFENYKSVVQKAFTPRKIIFGTKERLETRVEARPVPPSFDKTQENFSVARPTPVSFAGGLATPSEPGGGGGGFIGIAQVANQSNYSNFANTSNFATTASYVNFSQMSGDFNNITINGANGATGSIGTNITVNVTPDSGSVYIDSIPITSGNTAKWLISINDGVDNFKASEMFASWNNTMVKYYNTEVSEIGSVPVALSVDNTGGTVNLLATPFSGTWTIKMIRMVV